MNALEVENLRVTVPVGRRRRKALLDDVNLVVAEGEWVTIIGPNGAGKSTLLRAITRQLPYMGLIRIAGTDNTALNRKQRARLLASVAQNPTVPPGMTVQDYVLLGRTPYIPALRGESSADIAAVGDVLGLLELTAFARRELMSLSGGERQRVFLARALAQHAPLLLLDEPTTALDIGHQQDVLELVDELRSARGLTILSTMHDLSIAGEYADRMVLVFEGRIHGAGRPEDILTEANLRRYYGASVRVTVDAGGPTVVPIRRRRGYSGE